GAVAPVGGLRTSRHELNTGSGKPPDRASWGAARSGGPGRKDATPSELIGGSLGRGGPSLAGCLVGYGTACQSPAATIARRCAAARLATGLAPLRAARPISATRSAHRARSRASSGSVPWRVPHDASTPLSYAGSRSNRNRLPRSVNG